MPADVHLLKVDVPGDATPQTPWQITRLSMNRYFEPLKPVRSDWTVSARVGYRRGSAFDQDPVDTDVYAIHVRRQVSVTPLSLDFTSRVDLNDLEELLRRGKAATRCLEP